MCVADRLTHYGVGLCLQRIALFPAVTVSPALATTETTWTPHLGAKGEVELRQLVLGYLSPVLLNAARKFRWNTRKTMMIGTIAHTPAAMAIPADSEPVSLTNCVSPRGIV